MTKITIPGDGSPANGANGWAAYITSDASAPGPFRPPPPDLDEASIYRTAARRAPLWPWVMIVLMSSLLVVNTTSAALQLVAAVFSLGAVLFAARAPGKRARMHAQLLEEAKAKHTEEVERLRTRHDVGRVARESARAKAASLRERLPAAPEAGDTSLLSELLALALAGDGAPVSVEATVEVLNPRSARIALQIPFEGPDVDAALRATRSSPQDLAAAVVLRVARTALRALPSLAQVAVTGTPGNDSPRAAGRRVAVELSRAALDAADFRRGTATEILRSVGGVLEDPARNVPA